MKIKYSNHRKYSFTWLFSDFQKSSTIKNNPQAVSVKCIVYKCFIILHLVLLVKKMKLYRTYKQLFYITLLIIVIREVFKGSKSRNNKYRNNEENKSLLDQPVDKLYNKKEYILLFFIVTNRYGELCSVCCIIFRITNL